MAISFNQIPINLRVPGQYIEVSNEKANRGLNGYPSKALVIGQKLAAGAAAALEPLLITSVAQATLYFGEGSQLAHMLEAFKGANSFLEVWAIAQEDNPAGVKAAGSISVTGPASASGTINLYIAGRQVQIGVTAGDAASAIANAIVTAINANTALPVTAAIDGVDNFKLNVTARHAGEAANTIDMRANYYQGEALPAGVQLAITALSGGTANPVIGDVFTAIGDEWYTAFISAYNDAANVSALENELETRFGPLKMLDGHGYIAYANTHAGLVTTGMGRNSPHVSAIGVKASPTPTYEWAAAMGAVCAFNLQIDPARPVQTLELPGVLAPKIADRFTLEENNILLHNGISTFSVDVDGTVRLQRVITSYRLNASGASDISYLNVESLHTLSYLRYDTRSFIAQRFPRHKLANDGTVFGVGQPIVTPSIIRNALIARFKLWEEAGLVEGFEQFKKDLLVERDGNNPDRVNAIIPPDIINQFRIFAGKVEFYL